MPNFYVKYFGIESRVIYPKISTPIFWSRNFDLDYAKIPALNFVQSTPYSGKLGSLRQILSFGVITKKSIFIGSIFENGINYSKFRVIMPQKIFIGLAPV